MDETQQEQARSKKNHEKVKRFQSDRHRMQKREPRKPFQRENDLYITNKSDFNVIKTLFWCF